MRKQTWKRRERSDTNLNVLMTWFTCIENIEILWAFDTSTPTFCSIYSIHTSTTQAYDVESPPSVYKSIEHVHGLEHPDPGVSSQTQEILTNKDDHKDILCRANKAGPAHIDHGSHFALFAFWRAALQLWMAAIYSRLKHVLASPLHFYTWRRFRRQWHWPQSKHRWLLQNAMIPPSFSRMDAWVINRVQKYKIREQKPRNVLVLDLSGQKHVVYLSPSVGGLSAMAIFRTAITMPLKCCGNKMQKRHFFSQIELSKLNQKIRLDTFTWIHNCDIQNRKS